MAPFWIFLLGLLAVVGGAELIVRGASVLAARVGISPMVIGATVVAIGTSTPELAIAIEAAGRGSGALVLGNVAGSNTLNILFILGLIALIRPVVLRSRVIRFDLPVLVGAASLLLLLAADGVVSRVDGILLLALGLFYSFLVVRAARRESIAVRIQFAREFGVPRSAITSTGRVVRAAIWLIAGIAVVVVGADLLVDGAVSIARDLGAPEAVIGLTIVAIGTSAPELVTAVVAALRREQDLAVGNLIGSSIFNIVLILGIAALIPVDGVPVEPAVLWIDLAVMLGATIVCIPVFVTGTRISRLEGAALVAAYLAYFSALLLTRL
ncbi:calcium/sodium antiporter [Microbacterium sp.]|uniref:calcium/sodium antiporter n=1 Tax=Microbacterium sp. TaxID=51671 RepID=UPI003C299733